MHASLWEQLHHSQRAEPPPSLPTPPPSPSTADLEQSTKAVKEILEKDLGWSMLNLDVLDWEKHKTKITQPVLDVTPSPYLESAPSLCPRCPHLLLAVLSFLQRQEPHSHMPMIASPGSTHTGPVKTGGRVFVSDHKRWTAPMKEATDILLKKHHGKKDMIRPVDQEYAAMVLSSSTDPNSMFHSTTKLHISQYVKHLAKLLNTSSSLNTSPEKRLERQQLWYSLTEGSDTTSFPVMTVTPAVIQPPAPSLTHEAIKKIVEEVMERQ
ncbi:hypothetical protein QQF64_036427 [Cirrhinus molitorella]|uniref:Uncharacterized protein n=1 Tax=Cirrhinus molitorella TaxID=172907 RepID=A0ABR3NIS0_9TELE